MPVSLGTTISLSAYQYKVFSNKATSLSTHELPNSPGRILIYPNPVINGQVIIDIKTGTNYLKLELLDINGRKVLESLLHPSSNLIDVSSLKKGIYLAKFSNASGTYMQKIVIM
jgi:hypothetical protein